MEKICSTCKHWKAHKGTEPGLALALAWGDCGALLGSDKIEAYQEFSDETFHADTFETNEDFGCTEWEDQP